MTPKCLLKDNEIPSPQMLLTIKDHFTFEVKARESPSSGSLQSEMQSESNGTAAKEFLAPRKLKCASLLQRLVSENNCFSSSTTGLNMSLSLRDSAKIQLIFRKSPLKSNTVLLAERLANAK